MMTQSLAPSPVDAILLPQTPRSVAEAYRTLATRAREASFGLLEEDIVMLDTETTGLSFRHNELIEIAAAKMSGGEIVERFQTFVHPTGPIPPEIVALTGIRDVDVTDAPSASQAVQALADFVGGFPVVAHNASFDRTFIEAVEGGEDVTDAWIDSLALSRIALPRLSTHRLADMARAFGCDAVTHRAMADVDALCGMWRILLLALSDLPGGLLAKLAEMHEEVEWPYRQVLGYLAGMNPGEKFSLRAIRHDMEEFRTGEPRQDAFDLPWDSVPTAESIERDFAPGGLVDTIYDKYEIRPEQVTMALEVGDAIRTGTHRSIEAGTGVGKSMAYLVPGIAYAHANKVTIGVATKTNALTDQLVSHELPALAEADLDGVRFTSLKGCEHYPCMRRLERSMRVELPMDVTDEGAPEALTALAVTCAYACQSVDGDLDALGIRWHYVPRDMVATPSSECLRRSCPYYDDGCFVHGARRAAACSDVVVTNHALLLRDIDSDNSILPPIRHWVVDEAHSFETEARRQWAYEASGDEIQHALQRLGSVDRGVIHSITVAVSRMEGSKLLVALLGQAASWAHRTSEATQSYMDALHGLVGTAGFGGYDSTTLWVDETLRASDEWGAVEAATAKLVSVLEETTKALEDVVKALPPERAALSVEIRDPLRRLKSFCEAARMVVLEPQEGFVYAAELHRGHRRVGDSLVAQLVEVGESMAERWYDDVKSVIYTSATIAVGDSFEHFEHAVGLDALSSERHKSLRLSSSFDFDSNMSVVVARDMPAPNDRRYLAALEDLLYDVHCGMGGSVLTLFTNRREMERVYDRIKPRLAERGLDVACQKYGISPRRLREQFIAEEELSLFALKSFWEGFDAVGNTLRCVVVCKLPFASPREPLVRERELHNARSWWQHSLPEAVLEVKQAAGRLIRSATDTGVFVLADSRISSKRYGNTFLNALPTNNCIQLERANMERYLKLWRASHE